MPMCRKLWGGAGLLLLGDFRVFFIIEGEVRGSPLALSPSLEDWVGFWKDSIWSQRL